MTMDDIFVSTRDTETHRVCGACNKLKPLSEFYHDGTDSKGQPKYRRDCKECYKLARLSSIRAKQAQSKKRRK